jgi:hypothetical protein
MNFRTARFPSDVLSVGRLRKLFPDNFDRAGPLTDGYGDFFYPQAAGKPEHLERLNDLISAERVVADGAYYRGCESVPDEILGDEDRWCIDKARRELEDFYQYFRLADGPEAARLLILQVEDEGAAQARQAQGRTR